VEVLESFSDGKIDSNRFALQNRNENFRFSIAQLQRLSYVHHCAARSRHDSHSRQYRHSLLHRQLAALLQCEPADHGFGGLVQQRQDQSPEPLVWTVEGDSDTAVNRIESNRIVFFFAESPITRKHAWKAHHTAAEALTSSDSSHLSVYCKHTAIDQPDVRLSVCLSLLVTSVPALLLLMKLTQRPYSLSMRSIRDYSAHGCNKRLLFRLLFFSFFFPNVYHICMLDSIDDKNIDFRIKNIKQTCFFHFYKKHLKKHA